MILVTGGTGLVGSHLLLKLVQSNSKVRAIYRSENKLEAVKHVFSYFSNDSEALFSKIEWVKSDILDVASLEEQFQNITHVYHCAALVSFDPNDYYDLRKINIEGTANMVNLCVSNSIKKLCYVSSVAASGEELNNTLITENSLWNPETDHNVYAITKYGAEMEVWRGTQEGLDAVIVNPGIILGGGFWRSGSGSLFKKVYKGMSYYTNGTTGYIDVHDVTDIMMRLMLSPIKNEGYILISENWSIKDFTQTVAKTLVVKSPQKEAKPWLLNIAWRLDWLRHFFRGKRRRLTKHIAKSVTDETTYDNTKIKKELGIGFKPINTSIQEVSQLFLKDL